MLAHPSAFSPFFHVQPTVPSAPSVPSVPCLLCCIQCIIKLLLEQGHSCKGVKLGCTMGTEAEKRLSRALVGAHRRYQGQSSAENQILGGLGVAGDS